MRLGFSAAMPVLVAIVFLGAGCDSGGDLNEAEDTQAGVDTTVPAGDSMEQSEDSFEGADDIVGSSEDANGSSDDTSEPGEDSIETPEDTQDGICPPMAPYGTSQGDIVKDAVLVDCDGVEHSVHDLCEKKVTWIFSFSGW